MKAKTPKKAPKAKPAAATVAKAKTVEKSTTKSAAPKKAKARVTFTYRAEPGSTVYLAGCFNNWDPSAKQMIDKKNNGVYTAAVMLDPGSYEYKYVINGTWCIDPECADWVQNDHGTLNSVKHVGV